MSNIKLLIVVLFLVFMKMLTEASNKLLLTSQPSCLLKE